MAEAALVHQGGTRMSDEVGWVTTYATREQMKEAEGAYREGMKFRGHIIIDLWEETDKDGREEVHLRLSDGSKVRMIEKEESIS